MQCRKITPSGTFLFTIFRKNNLSCITTITLFKNLIRLLILFRKLFTQIREKINSGPTSYLSTLTPLIHSLTKFVSLTRLFLTMRTNLFTVNYSFSTQTQRISFTQQLYLQMPLNLQQHCPMQIMPFRELFETKQTIQTSNLISLKGSFHSACNGKHTLIQVSE